jgi:hypothetical protein
MKCFREIKSFPPVQQKSSVFLWGKIHFNKQKNIWAVKGTFQGKRYYFSQMPTSQGLVPCDSERMAKRLREMISVEIQNGNFVLEKYKASQPLTLKIMLKNGCN